MLRAHKGRGLRTVRGGQSSVKWARWKMWGPSQFQSVSQNLSGTNYRRLNLRSQSVIALKVITDCWTDDQVSPSSCLVISCCFKRFLNVFWLCSEHGRVHIHPLHLNICSASFIHPLHLNICSASFIHPLYLNICSASFIHSTVTVSSVMTDFCSQSHRIVS